MLKSPWLVFESPSRIAAAIGLCLTLVAWRGNSHVLAKCWKPCFGKLRKQQSEWITWVELALNGLCWVVPWGHVAKPLNHQVYLTCGWPPRSKEIGDVQVMKLPVQPQVIWALTWPTKLQELKPDGHRVVDVDRLERVRLVWGIASKRSCLSFHLAIWGKMSLMAKWVN
jgi:hypothetical protein